ncbi:hypothetical protein BJY52DRAFT_1315578 [Lactarius psammicola]|nr:hypothetical protein BJY52DRAFT_1315578 [Lactarius psammicola]
MALNKRQSDISTPPSSSPEPPSTTTTPSVTTPSSTPTTPTPTSTPEQTSSSPQPSPTTQATPAQTTTPQQGTSTTPTGNGSTRTSSSTSTLSSTSTSVYTSVFVTTGANGQIVTTTVQSTVIITPSVAASSGGGSSNTGAIVGGIVGGIAGLIAILLIGLFCWRRNRRRRDDFDGNFDPDRVVGHIGHTDLAGAEVTPYSYEPGVAGATLGHSGPSTGAPSSSGDGSMRQYHDSQALLVGSAGAGTATSGSHYAPTSSDSASAYPSSIAHSSSQHGIMPVPQPYRPMSTKEREALRQRGEGGLGLASALEEEEVIQHTDGGQIPHPMIPVTPPHEVPPSYDSIPGNDPR